LIVIGDVVKYREKLMPYLSINRPDFDEFK
jgi:hypothetical protein